MTINVGFYLIRILTYAYGHRRIHAYKRFVAYGLLPDEAENDKVSCFIEILQARIFIMTDKI